MLPLELDQLLSMNSKYHQNRVMTTSVLEAEQTPYLFQLFSYQYIFMSLTKMFILPFHILLFFPTFKLATVDYLLIILSE